VRFILFVEGYTEREAIGQFIKRWLDPMLSGRAGIRIVRFNGCSHFLGDISARARMHLEGPQRSDIIGGIGLLDLYIPGFYPEHLSSTEQRYAWAVQEIEGRVAHPKFRMFFAVHEVEAWILSQPELLPDSVRRMLPSTASQPESIDFDERLYRTQQRGRSYKKRTYGRNLLDRLDPAVAYQKCPHLAELLDYMLAAARQAGL
jgi:hypothetical protein